jgi:hypothetical protein
MGFNSGFKGLKSTNICTNKYYNIQSLWRLNTHTISVETSMDMQPRSLPTRRYTSTRCYVTNFYIGKSVHFLLGQAMYLLTPATRSLFYSSSPSLVGGVPLVGCPRLLVQTYSQLIWLGIRTGGRLLWRRYWNFGLHKIWGISEQLLASHEIISYWVFKPNVSSPVRETNKLQRWSSRGMCYVVYWGFGMFRWNLLPPSSGWLTLVHISAEEVGRSKYVDYKVRVPLNELNFTMKALILSLH